MPTKITAKVVAKARAEGKEAYIWDTELKGIGLRVSPKGQVSWLVQKWQGGREGKARRIVIGHCPPMELDDARRKAGAEIQDARNGVDIVQRRKQERSALAQAINAETVCDAIALYLKRNRKPGRYWDELEATFNRELGHFRNRTLASITKAELRHLIETKQEAHPGAARTLFAALRPFFAWCVQRDLIPASPMQALETPRLSQARDRVLTHDEVKSFWTATLADPLFGPFYRLLLLTAQRREEVAGMQWRELDLDKATWLIPKERTKNGKEHLVHLSPQAMKVINRIPRNSALILNSTLGTKLTGYSKAKLKIDKLMNCVKPWRNHDLRRTAASRMAALGFQPHIIERVLNHLSGAQGGLVSVYQRHEYLPERKRALEAWGTYVENLVTEKPVLNNVVPLVRA